MPDDKFLKLPSIKRVLINEAIREARPFYELYKAVRGFDPNIDAKKLYNQYNEALSFERNRDAIGVLKPEDVIPTNLTTTPSFNPRRRYTWKFTVSLEYDDGYISDEEWVSLSTDRELTIQEAVDELEGNMMVSEGDRYRGMSSLVDYTVEGVYYTGR